MSGHSKWNNIAKRKGANDAKKAKIFTKIGREMAIAIKEGGSANPDFNSRLRDCIAKAKANNMPNDNIKRIQNILIFVTETLKMTQRAEAYHQIILYFSECGFRKCVWAEHNL